VATPNPCFLSTVKYSFINPGRQQVKPLTHSQ